MRREYFEKLEKNLAFHSATDNSKCEIVEVPSLCPRGNYRKICEDLREREVASVSCKKDERGKYRIKRVWSNASYGYINCPFDCNKKLGY